MSFVRLTITALLLSYFSACGSHFESKKALTPGSVDSYEEQPIERAPHTESDEVTSNCEGRPLVSDLSLFNNWSKFRKQANGYSEKTIFHFNPHRLIISKECNFKHSSARVLISVPIHITGSTVDVLRSAQDQQSATWGGTNVECRLSIGEDILNYSFVGSCLELSSQKSGKKTRLHL